MLGFHPKAKRALEEGRRIHRYYPEDPKGRKPTYQDRPDYHTEDHNNIEKVETIIDAFRHAGLAITDANMPERAVSPALVRVVIRSALR